MATVTLGNIKFNWKGAWNSATAYVVDDVVSLSGSSYVCIQAGTNQNPSTATAYWEQMSSAGTDGTDLTTTLTTQGDILYRDGSGLARLGAGTSGQLLQTGGSGANPSWTTFSSDFVKLGETGAVSNQADVNLNGFFTSDYDVYKVFGSGCWGASSANAFWFRVATTASYTVSSASTYNYIYDGYYQASSSNGVTQGSAWNTDKGRIGWTGHTSATYGGSFELTVFQPMSSTVHKWMHMSWGGYDGSANTNHLDGWSIFRDTTPITGLNFFMAGGNMNADNIRIYGIKN